MVYQPILIRAISIRLKDKVRIYRFYIGNFAIYLAINENHNEDIKQQRSREISLTNTYRSNDCDVPNE